MNHRKYLAFISYRHADNRIEGRQWASWLHQALETYEIPTELVGSKNSRGDVIPERIFPVFRDEDELPAEADLGDAIVRALDNTQLLIVLCSPNAVASKYVADEIDYFKSNGGSDRIVGGIIDGEPNASWDSSKHVNGLTEADECFPIPLQFAYENGNRTDRRAEPVAADFRVELDGLPQQSWTNPEALRQHLQQTTEKTATEINTIVAGYQQQLKLMLLKMVAGVLGVPLGELTQRDREYQLQKEKQRAKQLRRWLAAVGLLAVLALIAGGFALLQRDEALQRTSDAQRSESAAIAEQARLALEASDYGTAMRLALSGLPLDMDNPERAWSPRAEAVLAKAFQQDPLLLNALADPNWTDADTLNKDPQHTELVLNESRLIVSGNAMPMLIAMPDQRIPLEAADTMPSPFGWNLAAVSADELRIAVAYDHDEGSEVFVWDTRDGKLVARIAGSSPQFGGQSQYLAVTRNQKAQQSVLIDLSTAAEVQSFTGTLFSLFNRQLLINRNRNCSRRGYWYEHLCEHDGVIQSLDNYADIKLWRGEFVYLNRDNGRALLSAASSDKNAGLSRLVDSSTMQTLHEFDGAALEVHPSSGRIITKSSERQQIVLWNLASGEKIANLVGKLKASRSNDRRRANSQVSVITEYPSESYSDDPDSVLTESKSIAGETGAVIRWRLDDGSQIVAMSGKLLQVDFWGRALLKKDDGSLEWENRDARNSRSPDICGDEYVSTSEQPSSALLSSCEGYFALSYTDYYESLNPQMVSTPPSSTATWIEDSTAILVDSKPKKIWGLKSHHYEAQPRAFPLLTVGNRRDTSYRGLGGSKWLAELASDSALRLWSLDGNTITASAMFEYEEQISQIDWDDLDPPTRQDYEQNLQSANKLGFGDAVKKLEFNYSDPDQASAEPAEWLTDWVKQDNLSEDAPLAQIEGVDIASLGFTAQIKYELGDGIILLADNANAVLITPNNPTQPRRLRRQEYDREYGDLTLDHSDSGSNMGVNWSDSHQAFVYYNSHGAWLFDSLGNQLLNLCDPIESCGYSLFVDWLEDGKRLVISNEDPSIYNLESGDRLFLCADADNQESCRQSSPTLGKRLALIDLSVVDLASGIHIANLSTELGFGWGVGFNENETAVMVMAETGGGSYLYEIFELPLLGQGLIDAARERLANLYNDRKPANATQGD